MLGKAALGTAALAVFTAFTISRVNPLLFLRVPHIGFVLYHVLAGGLMPPFVSVDNYANQTRYRMFLRDGDVLVNAGAKMGTHWAMTAVHALRTLNVPELQDFPDILRTVPWIEMSLFPGETFEEHWETMTKEWDAEWWDSPKYPFREFKSHLLPIPSAATREWMSKTDACLPVGLTASVVPVREFPKVKHVVMVRNGMDVITSFFPFSGEHTDSIRETWGGFPPKMSKMQESFDLFVPNEGIPNRCYARAWYDVRHEPNVLLLHFANFKRNPRKTMEQLATFLNVTVREDQWPGLLQAVSIETMKARNSHYLYHVGKGKVDRALSSLIRSGTVGEGDKLLTPEMKAQYQHLLEKVFPNPELRKWAEEGGDFPEVD